MFNLIMRSVAWNSGNETMPINRVFEYTDDFVADQFRENGNLLLDRLIRLPCLFMPEGTGAQNSYVGSIKRARSLNNEIVFEYTIDSDVPHVQSSVIYANRLSLDMRNDFEFSRNHWAVKDVDLYRFFLRNVRPRRQRPTVFRVEEHESVEPALASAMMPFETGFNPVYESIQQAAVNIGLRCRRADDIWEHAAIIQEVVSLIDRSRIVICDCTGRNPNVFYEAGIAHTLGREIIFIAQNEQDIPFDLRHLRYVQYLNTPEGRMVLTTKLQARMQTVLGH